jgi:hypothetical protein
MKPMATASFPPNQLLGILLAAQGNHLGISLDLLERMVQGKEVPGDRELVTYVLTSNLGWGRIDQHMIDDIKTTWKTYGLTSLFFLLRVYSTHKKEEDFMKGVAYYLIRELHEDWDKVSFDDLWQDYLRFIQKDRGVSKPLGLVTDSQNVARGFE